MRLLAWLVCLLTTIGMHAPALAQSLVVGGKNFTEQQLVARMTSQLLEAKGFSVITRTGFATSGIRKEQEAGLIDLYWEYTGTSLVTFNNVKDALDADETYARVKELDAVKGLVWLTPSRVDNTYALAMRRADAARNRIRTISDLAALVRQGETFRFACNTEFYIRPDGLLPLQRAYRFAFGVGDVVRMDTDGIYDALRERRSSVDVGLVFSTDGRVTAFDFVLLEDDRKFFPSYVLTPVVRQRTLSQHPELAGHLNALSAKLDNAIMAGLNGKVDLEKQRVEDVARTFLKEAGLL